MRCIYDSHRFGIGWQRQRAAHRIRSIRENVIKSWPPYMSTCTNAARARKPAHTMCLGSLTIRSARHHQQFLMLTPGVRTYLCSVYRHVHACCVVCVYMINRTQNVRDIKPTLNAMVRAIDWWWGCERDARVRVHTTNHQCELVWTDRVLPFIYCFSTWLW